MSPEDKPCLDRRRFVATALPACAATCLFLRGAPLAAAPQQAAPQPPDQKPRHKFDAEVPQKLTFRQGFALQYTRSFIPLALFLR